MKAKEKEIRTLPEFQVVDIDDFNLIRLDQKSKEPEDIDE
jgi:hypothetical protein